ncbi:hypothetical protein [Cupriavidus sp. WS]|uniref:hypothetical protein n=1 Tax=Cupriavidus sp. WS TaxID=1312922 RepID=UPI0012DC0551|nr:hypothetical protein [Cupriavidus sp. WS]
MRHLSIAVASTLILATSAMAAGKRETVQHASQPAPAKWAKEPDGFLGIKFSELFPQLPDCPRSSLGVVDFQQINQLPGLCFDGTSRSSYGHLWNLPKLGFSYSVTVMIAVGSPIDFTLTTSVDNYDDLVKVLIDRYGQPTSRTKGTVKTKVGAEFDNESLEWIGTRVSISLDKRRDSIDTSAVSIMDREYWKTKLDQQQREAAAGASKL